ncbi:MAG: DUF2029 domain-containing protein [Ktedonobacteraceae bacterium]|nr:DUF2029 domain-containing protein [Ktedonobacteraceae bacterium]
MSILQEDSPVQKQAVAIFFKRPEHRIALLCGIFAITLILLKKADALPIQNTGPIVFLWLGSFVPYLFGCILILLTRPQQGRWQWIEVGVILVGAALLRVALVATPPNFSGDAWRYLWDARVTLHDYSPYVYIPDAKPLVPLHDSLVYGQMGYHDVPTLYPPAAQALYLLSYLLAPSNIVVLKAIFLCFDLTTCGVLALLLKRRGLDPSRCILYAWCPLPVVEFAVQGHIDVVMLTFVVLMVLCGQSTTYRARLLTGLLLGLATLTKLYPLIFLCAVLRRRDYVLLLTCFCTIIAGYIPFIILGHGQVFGFFSTYLNQHGGNGGIVLVAIQLAGEHLKLSQSSSTLIEHGVAGVLIIGGVLAVLMLRLRERINVEMAILILIAIIFSISSFVYPWYVTALIPWVALLLGPLWTETSKGVARISARSIAVLAPWYFICTVDSEYLFLGKFAWSLYYILVYGGICALLLLALGVGLSHIVHKNELKILEGN